MRSVRNCLTCAHAPVPTHLEPCCECDYTCLPTSNWTPIAVVPKAPERVMSAAAPDTGYGCQTCKFTAVDPNAAPCRGCWSPSVSGKGSNWTAP